MEFKVCIGEYCHLKGAEVIVKKIKDFLQSQSVEGRVDLKGSFCMGRCQEPGITVEFDKELYKVTIEDVDNFLENTVKSRIK